MGGYRLREDDESCSNHHDFSRSSSPCSCCSRDDCGCSEENTPKSSPIYSNHPSDLRKRDKAYQEILQSYDVLQERLSSCSSEKLKLARRKILSYTPGAWIDGVSDVNSGDYDIPKTTSIIIVGPKGAGKSSLVNRIIRVIEDDEFAADRAQVSYGSPSIGGTFFLQRYMIPRGSASFCLYDTRGLCQSSSDNTNKIKQWITSGVRHGEPVIWESDFSDLVERLTLQAHGDGGTGCVMQKVNSIIFVVNAADVLKSMESGIMTETSYADLISNAFNCPLLSFKDDKPAVVMTHGDILSIEERARVRVFLGELLSIPPDKQIFDISESRDAAMALTICDLLRHSLEHADKNLEFLPTRNSSISKVGKGVTKRSIILTLMILLALPLLLAVAMNCFRVHAGGRNVAPVAQPPRRLWCPDQNVPQQPHVQPQPSFDQHISGHGCVNRGKNVTHVLKPVSESVPVPDVKARRIGKHKRVHKRKSIRKSSFDWHTARHLWFDDEAEPSLNWRRRQRLWFVE